MKRKIMTIVAGAAVGESGCVCLDRCTGGQKLNIRFYSILPIIPITLCIILMVRMDIPVHIYGESEQ